MKKKLKEILINFFFDFFKKLNEVLIIPFLVSFNDKMKAMILSLVEQVPLDEKKLDEILIIPFLISFKN